MDANLVLYHCQDFRYRRPDLSGSTIFVPFHTSGYITSSPRTLIDVACYQAKLDIKKNRRQF